TIKANDLEIKMSGASDFDGAIESSALVVDLAGASDMTVSGITTNLKVEVSGASEFKGYGLQTDNCSARASGASDIKITVNKELNAQASGASGVYYKGNGVIREIKSNGASSVSKKS
ncbi:MAG: GIN domain-containing protein, partial [Flavitalea sp.]